MADLQSTSEIIDHLGGNAPVAKLTSTTSKAVSNWRAFRRFPANTYVAIQAELRRQGKSAPDHLWSMRLPTVAKRRKALA